jgi:hypothetical protein
VECGAEARRACDERLNGGDVSRHCERSGAIHGAASGEVDCFAALAMREDASPPLKPCDFISPAKQSVTGFLQALQARHIGLASLVQTIEIGQFGLDLGEVKGFGHAVQSLLCGLIGCFKGLVVGGAN